MKIDICKLVGRDKHHLVQLCLPYEKLKAPLSFPVLASEKLDGVFAFAVIQDTEVHIFSRTGEEYKSLEHLKPELWDLHNMCGYEVFIFECYAKGVPQPTISGWCRDTKKQHLEVDAYIHDGMTWEEFKNPEDSVDYKYRQSSIALSFFNIGFSHHHLHFLRQEVKNNEVELMQMANEIWAAGGEGVVARPLYSGYQPGKRNAGMVKLKKGVSFDLKVVSLEEGTGKYKNHVGKLVCADRNGKVIKVGSGLTDEERKRWWSEFFYDEIVGKIVQVDAMAVSTKGVLREPRFKGIRHDKTEVDAIC